MELTIEQALQQGVAAHKEGKLQDAERLYRAILQSQPAHPDANHSLGILAVSVNKPDVALPLFKTAVEANPKTEQFWLSYIGALIKTKKYDEARRTLADAKQTGIVADKLRVHEEKLQSEVFPCNDIPQQELSNQSQDRQDELSPAIELREVGKYKEAQEWLSDVIENDPKNAEALSLLSQVLLLDKKEVEAERVLTAAVSINSELPSIYHNKARLLLRQSKTTEALKIAQLGCKQLPEDLESLLVLAACLGADKRDLEALLIIEKILKAKSNHAEAYANRALIKLRATDAVGAIEDAKMAVSIKPHLTQMWQLLGSLYYQSSNLVDAIEALRIAHKNEPRNPALMIHLGEFLRQDNKAGEAITILEQAKELSPKDAKVWINLGVAYQQEERIADAKIAYENALAINPKSAAVFSNLGIMAKAAEELESALHYFERALEVEPNLAEANRKVGVTLQELGRLDEALESYNKAIELKPDSPEAHINLGNTLKALGRLNEAGASYNQAIALNPDYAEAHYNLGNTLKELGRLDEAEASYNQAVALTSGFAEAHYSLGITLKEQGRIEESVFSFQQAFASRTGIRPVGEKVLAPATTSFFFELTNKCNFHCTFCPSDDQKRSLGSMDLELVKLLYEEASDKNLASTVNLHLMGEPTLHPKLIEVLKFGASKNIKTDLVTNISTLVAKNIPKILDALYGTITASHMTPTEETYHFRGKVRLPWDKYISNLRLLVREYMQRLADGVSIKNDIIIRIMVSQNTAANVNIIGTSNEAVVILKEWNDFVAEVEQELGMVPFERKDHNADDLVRGNKYRSTSYHLQQGIKLTFWRAFTFANTRVSDDFDLKATRQSSYCYHPFTDVGVLWNGDVTLCCLDHDGELKVGNVLDSSIEAVIQSDAAQKLRASMVGDYPLPSICQKCQERPVKRENG